MDRLDILLFINCLDISAKSIFSFVDRVTVKKINRSLSL